MAPTKKEATKEKEKKLSPQEASKAILEYLARVNRPYSAVEISGNIKGGKAIAQAAAKKLLKDMHERKEIEGVTAGKSIVYHVLQEEPEESFEDKLAAMDVEISRLREETGALKSEEKDLRLSIREGAVLAPLHELKSGIAAMETEKEAIEMRLRVLKSGHVRPIAVEDRERVRKNYQKWQKCAAARKKIRKEMWNHVLDFVGKEKAEETKEELGLEHMVC